MSSLNAQDNKQDNKQDSKQDNKIVTIRPDADTMTRQNLPYFIGISAETAGSKGISMHLATIPPGASAEPHSHPDHETAIYLIKGQIETRYGEELKHVVVHETGDFIFIPPGVPHQPRNLSMTETAYAIVARTDPNDQEKVVLYDPS